MITTEALARRLALSNADDYDALPRKGMAPRMTQDDYNALAAAALDAIRQDTDLLVTACRAVLATYDEWYPADLFTGSAGDPGAVTIRHNRELLMKALEVTDDTTGRD